MINANELRIGNWVNFTYTHAKKELTRSCKVATIGDDIVVHDKGVSLIAKFTPISLTPEILERCGFDRFYYLEFLCYRVGDFSLQKTDEGFFHLACHAAIENLHQLQNLYFALTGEELVIKEETPA